MEFGILSWGGIGSSKLKKISQLQKKCVRNVSCTGIRSHTDPIFSRLNILKLDDLFSYNSSMFVHKLNNEMLPVSFEKFLVPLTNPNRSNGYIVDKTKNKFLEQFPNFFLPKNWNNLTLDFKLEASHKTFKKTLVENFIDKYSRVIRCRDRLCVDCQRAR